MGSDPRIIRITETTDPRIERFANLRSDAVRRFDGDSFIVEGRWCVRRLVESPLPIMSVLIEQSKEDSLGPWLPHETPVYSLPSDQIRQLVGFHFHRGILACGRRPNLEAAEALQFRPSLPQLALAAIGVNQDENLGSMIRTAAALGIENLLIGPNTADPLSRRSIRVSMATIFQQQLFHLESPLTQLPQLQRNRNIRTIVTTLDRDATPLSKFARDDREMVLVVGNEADGIDPAVQAIATDRITIPMKLGTDSLNVSVAAAIFMYELVGRPRC